MDNDIIAEFFSGKYEKEINKSILYYSFTENDVSLYIQKLINSPISAFLEYMDLHPENIEITSKDIFQFSSFEDATYCICSKLNRVNNPGLKFMKIGQMLLDDNNIRKNGAFIKYGENHAKTAEALGLVFKLYHTYYLSGIGYIFIKLTLKEREELLVRLVLRNKLIKVIYQASKKGRVDLRKLLFMISDSTYVRRRSNIKKVLEILSRSDEYDFSSFIKALKF